jgi:hypothetical protein
MWLQQLYCSCDCCPTVSLQTGCTDKDSGAATAAEGVSFHALQSPLSTKDDIVNLAAEP